MKKPGWKQMERRVANDTDGRLQPGSGAPWGNPGDVETKRTFRAWWSGVIYECKQTRARQYTLRLDTFNKVKNEAMIQGKLGVMVVEIDGTTVGVIDYQTLLDLINEHLKLMAVVNNPHLLEELLK